MARRHRARCMHVLGVAPPAAVAALFMCTATASAAAPTKLAATHEAVEAGRWSLVIAAAALIFGLPVLLFVIGAVVWAVASVGTILKAAGTGIGSGFRKMSAIKAGPNPWPPLLLADIFHGLLVGTDKRLSTSKTVAAVWTYALASALLSLVVAKWIGHGQALDNQIANGLQSQYGVLIGGPLGAAILAKGIVSSQISAGTAAKTPADEQEPLNASQLVSGDGPQASTDLGDFQYLLFNVVALAFFFGELVRAPVAGLPTLPDLLVGLTSVSAIGYVGKKTLTSGAPTITGVDPEAAAPGTKGVRISGTGLVENGANPVEVGFGDRTATLDRVLVEHGLVLEVTVPLTATPGELSVYVKTASGKHARSAKPFKVL